MEEMFFMAFRSNHSLKDLALGTLFFFVRSFVHWFILDFGCFFFSFFFLFIFVLSQLCGSYACALECMLLFRVSARFRKPTQMAKWMGIF